MSRVSASQLAVLEWLVAYPGITILWEPGWFAQWSSWWRNEDARQHMLTAMVDLGGDMRMAAPRSLPRGGTPRLTTPTFEALLRRGYVKEIATKRWQISLDGAMALNPALSLVRGRLAAS